MVNQELLSRYAQEVEEKYRQMTPKSRQMLEIAKEYVAGGVTRETCWWKPYPIWIEKGEGCHLFDVDGNILLDYNNCFTAGLLGHCHPKVVTAIQEAAPKLLSVGAATESIHQWAQILCGLYPSVDKMRFCCSGTEAVMYACRAARAYTNRSKIMKERGSYHGTANEAEIGMPTSQRGIPKHAGADMLYVNFSDREETERLARENKDDLAGILANGIWVTRENGNLRFLRELANKYDALLIVDEIMSYRYAMGGAQEYFGVEGDITALGKFIGGGGLAVGAFGGREEIMRLFSPLDQEEPVHAAGTFAGNPLTVAAGIAALKEMTPELIGRLNALGDSFRAGVRDAFAEMEIKGFAGGESSLVMTRIGELTVDPRRAAAPPTHREIMRLFGLSLLNKKMFTPASGAMWALSAPMTEREIEQAVTAITETLAEVKPVIKEVAPELMLS